METPQSISSFCRKYLAGIYPSSEDYSAATEELSNNIDKNEVLQNILLEKSVLSKISLQYPPQRDFQLKVTKKLIAQIEEIGVEVDDRLYHLVSTLLSAPSPSQLVYQHHTLENGASISIGSDGNSLEGGTTGGLIWHGAFALVEWAISNCNMLENYRILELGCGLGLAGISILKTCKVTSYCFTDSHPRVMDRLRRNLDLNFPGTSETCPDNQDGHGSWHENETEIHAEALDWRDENKLDEVYKSDVILGSDITFVPELFPDLLNSLKRLFALNPEAACFLIHSVRSTDTIRQLRLCLDQATDFKTEESHLDLPFCNFPFHVQPESTLETRLFRISFSSPSTTEEKVSS